MRPTFAFLLLSVAPFTSRISKSDPTLDLLESFAPAPPAPRAPLSPGAEQHWKQIWEARLFLEKAEVAHAASNGTTMLGTLLHILGKPSRVNWTAASRLVVRETEMELAKEAHKYERKPAHNSTHGRRTFAIHEKEWCYACKCTTCPDHANAAFHKGKVSSSNVFAPSPPLADNFQPEDVCPPIVPNPASFPLWATAIASQFLVSPVSKHLASSAWKDAGWSMPLYMPRRCLVKDNTWTPLGLTARLLRAAVALSKDECTNKCWQNYGCWKCGGEFGMWIDGYPWKKSEYEKMDVPANSYYWSRSFGSVDYRPYRLGAGDEVWEHHLSGDPKTDDEKPKLIPPTEYVNPMIISVGSAKRDPETVIPLTG